MKVFVTGIYSVKILRIHAISLKSFLNCIIEFQVVHEKLVKMSDGGATTGSFSVDPSLGHNTKFGVYVEVVYF